jgi:hypothetical protein
MPFVADRKLERMVDPTAVTRAGRTMTAKGGGRLHHDTQQLTPVYVPRAGDPPRARRPGTLRRSVKKTPVRRHVGAAGTTGWAVRVYTEDPVGPHVEWTTRPHDIPNAFGWGPDFGIGGRFSGKFHPGTTGQHMFARAAAILNANVHRMFAPELAEFARDLTGLRSGTTTDRRSR